MVTLVKGLQDPVDPSEFFFRGADPFGCFFGIAFFWLHTGATELGEKISREDAKAQRLKRSGAWYSRKAVERI
jgi:hypothetical protein